MRSAGAALLLAVAGCASAPVPPAPPTDDTAPGPADRVFRLLAGRFDSADQARASPGYRAIQVVACPAEVPGLGPRALYVEQAAIGTPGAPERQRVHVVESASADASAVTSRVFELRDPSTAVGACERDRPPRFDRDALTERTGCAVMLHESGAVFRGGTAGRTCPSGLRGATYATSEIVLDAAGFRSWDRGFDATGTQVWGAEAGPSIFVRRGPPAR